ncbi:MAG: valine--tRNA ligase [Dehalococcoidia bacterium]
MTTTETNKPTEMAKAYDSSTVEQRIYEMWERGGYFKPRVDPDKKPFTIIQPPPNVTGELHLGHALTSTIEDILIRWHRMKGDPTLWMPGLDHAAISTQNVVERELAKEGISRHDLGREKFLERVWEWVNKYRHVITDQHKRLGVSADWDRIVFTLDPQVTKAVRTTFLNLYNDGLIYRGERLINWCPKDGTALSDLEVKHEEVAGHLWYLRYPVLKDGSESEVEPGEFFVVATTRPETMVADTAVAINPASERWLKYRGRRVLLPIVDRPIPVIEDEAVDVAFGTGALKITPGHDFNDFEIGQRHGLPVLNGMTLDGHLSEVAGPYEGVERFAARAAIVSQLGREGLLEKVEDYTTSIGHCDRCNTIVEPLISTQWFVKMEPLAKEAIRVVRRNQIRIVPDRFYATYFQWMENIRDWCISRQIWWGHRIPVWYCADGHMFAAIEDPTTCAECGSTAIEQDEDTLDTWFSSQLWPHVTLGWPDKTKDLEYFYPTSVMETGYDIIFFWVARMIMIGLYNTGEIPFEWVYLHGMVLNKDGKKMSKSKGTGVDPLPVIDKYGADALRFVLAAGGGPGNDMRLSDQKLEGGRNFANKLWNIARYVISTAANSPPSPGAERASRSQSRLGDSGGELGDAGGRLQSRSARGELALEDRWILSRATQVAGEADHFLSQFLINEAAQRVRNFVWDEFADWYVEMSKVRLREGDQSPIPVLREVLDTSLRLLHPFMPFVTEEIWQNGGAASGATEPLIVAEWPTIESGKVDEEAEAIVEIAIEIVRSIRNTRAEKGVEPGRWVEAHIQPRPAEDWIALRSGLVGRQIDMEAALQKLAPVMSYLARVKPLHLLAPGEAPPTGEVVTSVLSGAIVTLPVGGLFDVEAERARIAKQVAEAEDELSRLKSKLGDANFRVKAPKEIVAHEEARLASVQSRLEGLRGQLDQLG